MFAGLDDIDWPSMRHAYGSASGVPAWIRGLVDADPAVRAPWPHGRELTITGPHLTGAALKPVRTTNC